MGNEYSSDEDILIRSNRHREHERVSPRINRNKRMPLKISVDFDKHDIKISSNKPSFITSPCSVSTKVRLPEPHSDYVIDFGEEKCIPKLDPLGDAIENNIKHQNTEVSSQQINIIDLVKRNSITAHDENDIRTLLDHEVSKLESMGTEVSDYIGDFPLLTNEDDIVEAFDQLFDFVASYNFQLVMINHRDASSFSLYVIRPVPKQA